MRRPALLILAAPVLHGLGIVLNLAVRRIELQLAVHLPCNVRKLKHRNCDVANRDRRIQLLALANSRDEVGKVQIRHRVAPRQVRRRGAPCPP